MHAYLHVGKYISKKEIANNFLKFVKTATASKKFASDTN